jgi:hypothetical protein
MPVSRMIKSRMQLLTHFGVLQALQSLSCEHKKGQPSSSASLAYTDAIKAVTTTKTREKRIVCGDVIWYQKI